MLEQQRQAVDLKPLPPPPSEKLDGVIEKGFPGQPASDQKATSGLFKKLTTKLLKSPATGQFNTPTLPTAKRNSTARSRKAPPPPNDFTSKEQREAALRERGLIAAPKKDLSQIEQALDQKYAKITPIPRDQATKNGQQSDAEKIIQEWKARNQAGHV